MTTQQINVLPRQVNLTIYAGDGVELRLTAVDAETGESLDLAGVIDAQVKASRRDTEPMEAFAVGGDLSADGILDLSLSGDQTAALLTEDSSRFDGAWDVQWVADGEQPRTLVQGTLTCVLDVTRSV